MSVYFIMIEYISSILNLSLQGQQLLPIPQASKIKVVSYVLQSSQVKRTPQNSINKFIIQKLSPLAVVDFRLISTFLHA